MMRIIFAILSIVLVIAFPYWVYLPFIFLGIILFPLYIEAVILALIIDVIYGKPDAILLGFPFGIAAALLLIFAQPMRKHLRFNA